MNYYNEIKQKLIDNEIYQRVKDYSKERNKVITYFEIGKLLYKAGSVYGENIILKYSEKLMKEVNKNYNYRTLYRMRKLYEVFQNENLTTLLSNLTWSHYIQLLSIKDYNKIYYYIKVSSIENLSVRELCNRIKNKEYERLDESTKLKLLNDEDNKVSDFVKNPILIKNSYNYINISEKILKKLILEDLDNFMNELGSGFSYIGNEYKIKLGNTYNYIDLLLYNIKYKCYIVIELKVTELKKEYLGQIQTYMNYIDKNLKTIEEDKTIGIIICKKNNHFIMEYCSDKRILSREYNFI